MRLELKSRQDKFVQKATHHKIVSKISKLFNQYYYICQEFWIQYGHHKLIASTLLYLILLQILPKKSIKFMSNSPNKNSKSSIFPRLFILLLSFFNIILCSHSYKSQSTYPTQMDLEHKKMFSKKSFLILYRGWKIT